MQVRAEILSTFDEDPDNRLIGFSLAPHSY
jgi:hypothetical protein